MSKIAAVAHMTDVVPGRDIKRKFTFETQSTMDEVLEPGFLLASELPNVQVGESCEISGPGYVLDVRVIGKHGTVDFERVGTHVGPDQSVNGIAEIPAGEVHVNVQHGMGVEPRAGAIHITPVDDIGLYMVTNVGEDGFDVDVTTASIDPMEFNWRVDL